MIIEKKPQTQNHIRVDLTGPDGNAFALLGLAQNLAKQLGYDKEERDALKSEMMEGDYENLIQTLDAHFGAFVIMER